jgi:hypothetical protein
MTARDIIITARITIITTMDTGTGKKNGDTVTGSPD